MRSSTKSNTWMILAGIVVIIALVFGGCQLFKSTEREVTTTIEDKERVCDSNRDCKYLIFTDTGTYQITDSWIYFRFNSSDVYGKLKVGQKYQFNVAGVRFGLTSNYPTVVSDPVKVQQ